jgi:hypothetical protein
MLSAINPPDDVTYDKITDLSMGKMVKRQTAFAIKREIRKNDLTLKELIDKFYELEEEHTIKNYVQGLNLHFTYVVAQGARLI